MAKGTAVSKNKKIKDAKVKKAMGLCDGCPHQEGAPKVKTSGLHGENLSVRVHCGIVNNGRGGSVSPIVVAAGTECRRLKRQLSKEMRDRTMKK